MSGFLKYMHIERLGTVETDGILDGQVYIFPKIDGTNASVWWDKNDQNIGCGSRNRELTITDDLPEHVYRRWLDKFNLGEFE